MPMWLALFLGCGEPEPDLCADEAAPTVLAMRTITLTRAIDGTADGFDLDGVVSGAQDPAGCGIVDYVTPEGVPGVDNAFAALLPALELVGGDAIEGLIQSAIGSGELLLLTEILGLDRRDDDPCTEMNVVRATGEPLLGTDGLLEPGQTYERDPEITPVPLGDVALVDGSLTVHHFDLSIPAQFFDRSVTIGLTDASMRVDLHEDGTATGILAGGASVPELVTLAESIGEEVADLAAGAVRANADLSPDENGECQRISLSLDLTATPGFLYE